MAEEVNKSNSWINTSGRYGNRKPYACLGWTMERRKGWGWGNFFEQESVSGLVRMSIFGSYSSFAWLTFSKFGEDKNVRWRLSLVLNSKPSSKSKMRW